MNKEGAKHALWLLKSKFNKVKREINEIQNIITDIQGFLDSHSSPTIAREENEGSN